MLDQNTDRMWYVIGAVIVGAAIIALVNGSLPQLFANVTDSFEGVSNQTLVEVNSGNVLYDGGETVSNEKYHMHTYDLVHDDIPYGTQMTITMKAELHPDKTEFGFYNSSGHGSDLMVTVGHDDFNSEGVAQKSFTWDYRVDEVSNSLS